MKRTQNEQSQTKSPIEMLWSGELQAEDPLKVKPGDIKTDKPKKPDQDVKFATSLTPEAVACKKHILSLTQFSKDKWSEIGEIAHRKIAGTDAWSQHTYGNALDWHSTPDVMQQLADYLVNNAKKLNVRNVIYNRRIWNSSKGWYSYTGKHPHTDHVHVDFKKSDTKSPGPNAMKFHENVDNFANNLFSFITTDAEKYFKKFKWTWTNWGDDEQGARKYFDDQVARVKQIYGINNQSFKTALPQTQHNIKQLNAVIDFVGSLISNGKQGYKTITYKYKDKKDNQWKDQKVKFIWDYM
jgi:hypothetical protein